MIYSIPYIFFFIFLLVDSIPYSEDKFEKFRDIKSIILFLIILFFIGLRSLLYTDFLVYYQLYKDAPSLFEGWYNVSNFFRHSSYGQTMEKGFILYTIIIKSISGNFFFFQFINTLVDLIILYYFFSNYLKDYFLFGFCFYFVFSGLNIEINLFRNAKSIMLFLLAIKYIEKKSFIKYMMIVIFSAFFHTSSLLYIPFYFFINKKYSNKIIYLLFILGNIVYLLQLKWIVGILRLFAVVLGNRLRLFYLITNYISKVNIAKYGISIGYLERLFTFFIIKYFEKKICERNKSNIIFINFFYVYLFINLYCSEMFILVQRVSLLFIFSYWIIYPEIYHCIKKNSKKLYICIFMAYSMLKIATLNNTLMTKYENCLFSDNSYSRRKTYIELSQ